MGYRWAKQVGRKKKQAEQGTGLRVPAAIWAQRKAKCQAQKHRRTRAALEVSQIHQQVR